MPTAAGRPVCRTRKAPGRTIPRRENRRFGGRTVDEFEDGPSVRVGAGARANCSNISVSLELRESGGVFHDNRATASECLLNCQPLRFVGAEQDDDGRTLNEACELLASIGGDETHLEQLGHSKLLRQPAQLRLMAPMPTNRSRSAGSAARSTGSASTNGMPLYGLPPQVWRISDRWLKPLIVRTIVSAAVVCGPV